MSMVSKDEIIKQVLTFLERKLREEVPPEDDFESTKYEQVANIIVSKLRHVKTVEV